MPYARLTDPQTSHDAADAVENVSATQSAILLILAFAKTDQDLVDAYYSMAGAGLAPNASPSGIRSRRAELVKRGLVVDSGRRVKLASGRQAVLWQVA
jgi:hypothetical protein